MTVTAKPLIATKYAENSLTTQYTAPSNTRTIVDKMTATNNSASAVTFSVYLVPSGGSADGAELVASISVGANTIEEITVVEGHVLAAGDFIATNCGTATALVIRASGREVN
jgi:hypothetical protein